MQGVMTSCFQKCKTGLTTMKKLARTTRYRTIRGSQPKAERLSSRAGHSAYLVQILDRWLVGFRKHAPVGVNSKKGGTRPLGRDIENKN